MKKFTTRNKLSAVATVLAALLLAAAATPGSTAHAAATREQPVQATAPTLWIFQSKYNDKCLAASTTPGSIAVFAADCGNYLAQQWDWLSYANPDGQHQLKNVATGYCLTTQDTWTRNDVWMKQCDSRIVGQFWSFDYDGYGHLYADTRLNTPELSLRVSGDFGSRGVFESREDYDASIGIEKATHWWWGAHN